MDLNSEISNLILSYILCSEVFLATYSEKWKAAKKSGLNGLKKFAGPQTDIEGIMMKEVCIHICYVQNGQKCAATP